MKEDNYLKISTIDAMKGIRTPHESDLEEIGKIKLDLFRTFSTDVLQNICKEINAHILEMDLGEEWAISKEYFPGANVHVLYQYYGDEFGDNKEDEIQFLFSGDKVSIIPGEDLSHFVEITADYMELFAQNKNFDQVYSGKPSDMLKIALKERSAPFFKMDQTNFKEMAKFIGAEYLNEQLFTLIYRPFPKFEIKIWGNEQKNLQFSVQGDAVSRLPVYDSERLIIMAVNHCLRYIKNILKEDAPKICNVMFSGFYKKRFPEKFE